MGPTNIDFPSIISGVVQLWNFIKKKIKKHEVLAEELASKLVEDSGLTLYFDTLKEGLSEAYRYIDSVLSKGLDTSFEDAKQAFVYYNYLFGDPSDVEALEQYMHEKLGLPMLRDFLSHDFTEAWGKIISKMSEKYGEPLDKVRDLIRKQFFEKLGLTKKFRLERKEKEILLLDPSLFGLLIATFLRYGIDNKAKSEGLSEETIKWYNVARAYFDALSEIIEIAIEDKSLGLREEERKFIREYLNALKELLKKE